MVNSPTPNLPSKSRIDKAGRYLSDLEELLTDENIDEIISLEQAFDRYREAHLEPLTELTIEIQTALGSFDKPYYVAQRLKRRPQIIRKLNRLSVRLTQLQDIGGLRVVVDNNSEANAVDRIINKWIESNTYYELQRTTDYRPEGRDDSGYRAIHKIIERDGLKLEIQIRSMAQHFWAESIERTSVFYGKRLKEGEGGSVVLGYFKLLSNVFQIIEGGWVPHQETLDNLESLRSQSEGLIRKDGYPHLLDSYVNLDVVKTLIETERSNPKRLNNWILVFNWKTANFVTWEAVSRSPSEAMERYSYYEKQFPETEEFEVVLIGSSDVATVQKTHSHYFGIASPKNILEGLLPQLARISEDDQLDRGAKKILSTMATRKIWGNKHGVTLQNLKNHFCKDVADIESAIELLVNSGLLLEVQKNVVSLNVAKTADIEEYIYY